MNWQVKISLLIVSSVAVVTGARAQWASEYQWAIGASGATVAGDHTVNNAVCVMTYVNYDPNHSKVIARFPNDPTKRQRFAAEVQVDNQGRWFVQGNGGTINVTARCFKKTNFVENSDAAKLIPLPKEFFRNGKTHKNEWNNESVNWDRSRGKVLEEIGVEYCEDYELNFSLFHSDISGFFKPKPNGGQNVHLVDRVGTQLPASLRPIVANQVLCKRN